MKRLLVCAIALGVTLSAGIATAAPGDPDPGFGSAGVVTGGLLDTFGALDVDTSERVVVAGTTGGQAALARYTATGAPDTGFSDDGRVELGLTGVGFRVFDLRTLDDGSTVVAFLYRTDPMDPYSWLFAVAKVSATGGLVGGYGSGGTATYPLFGVFLHPDGAIASDGSVTFTAQFSGIPNNSGHVQFDANGNEVADATNPQYDTSLVPAGCNTMGGYAARGVVRPTTTDEIHVGLAMLLCPGDTEQSRVVLTSQALVSGAINWSVMLPIAETADFDDTIAIDLVGSDVVFESHVGATTHVHRYTTSGAPVGSWGAGGVATLAAGFGEVGGFTALANGRVGAVNGGRLRVAVRDTAHRSAAVERCRRLDVPEGVDADGWRPDHDRHRRRRRRWRARHHAEPRRPAHCVATTVVRSPGRRWSR